METVGRRCDLGLLGQAAPRPEVGAQQIFRPGSYFGSVSSPAHQGG